MKDTTSFKYLSKSPIIIHILLNLFSRCIMAQENFEKGYIILTNKDTLKGFVDIREWSDSPSIVNFKADNGGIQSISTSDIREFSGTNSRYVFASVEIELSPYLASELDSSARFNIKEEKVFIRELIAGSKPLFCYINKQNQEFYYLKTDSSFELLRFKKYFQYRNFLDQYGYHSKKLVFENNTYLNQIAKYLSNCKEVLERLQATKYTRKSLVTLFEIYHKCSPLDSFKINKHHIYPKTELGIITSATITNLSFGGSNLANNYLLRTDFKPTLNIGLGMYANFTFKNSKRDFAFVNELLYTGINGQGGYSIVVGKDDYSNHTTCIDIYIVRLNNLIRLTKYFDQLQISICLGMYTNLLVSQNNSKIDELRTPASPTSIFTKQSVKIFSSNINLGFATGFGLRFSRFGIDTRYEIGFDTSGPEELITIGSMAKLKSLVFLLSYRI